MKAPLINQFERSAAVPLNAVGFEQLRTGLMVANAHERPREITDIDPMISEGRSFLSIEQGAEGKRIVREHLTFKRPTIAKPKVLSAIVTRLSTQGDEVMIEHGMRYENDCEDTARYFTENLSNVQEHVGRANLFGAIALAVIVLGDLLAVQAQDSLTGSTYRLYWSGASR